MAEHTRATPAAAAAEGADAALDLIYGVLADLEDSNGVARPACLTLAGELREALRILAVRPAPAAAPREGKDGGLKVETEMLHTITFMDASEMRVVHFAGAVGRCEWCVSVRAAAREASRGEGQG